jgi:tRNA1Val (adenine37-N6)-methyltransferase
VLLGAWVDSQQEKRILEVGTGTGVIALMIAQKNTEAVVDAIDIQPSEVDVAQKNFQLSPWPSRLQAHVCSLQDWQAEPYDHIVSNPPYFINSAKAPDAARTVARHADSLSLDDLVFHSKRLLSTDGKLSVILPPTEGMRFITQASLHQLFLARQCAFRTRAQKPVERLLLEFHQSPVVPAMAELTLYETDNNPTPEYYELTQEFYLYRKK